MVDYRHFALSALSHLFLLVGRSASRFLRRRPLNQFRLAAFGRGKNWIKALAHDGRHRNNRELRSLSSEGFSSLEKHGDVAARFRPMLTGTSMQTAALDQAPKAATPKWKPDLFRRSWRHIVRDRLGQAVQLLTRRYL